MKKLFIFCILIIATNSFAQKKLTTANCQLSTKFVNPFIGTGGHGHTFPGPTMPFGACQVGPDTRLEGWDGCSGYHYSDSVIYGFSHTHLSGTGCSDYGDILLMPVTKEMQLDNYQYASKFSHNNEKAHAGYYQVYLDEPKVNVELTSTLHGGFHKYTYQKNDEQYVVLDLKHRDEVLDSRMEQVDDYTIRGYRFSKAWAKNQKVFFEIKFSKKIENIQYEESKTGSNTSAIRLEKSLHCIIKFQNTNSKFQNETDNRQPTSDNILVKVAISGVDEEGAHKNLIAEMPNDNWNFDFYKNKCENEWEKELSKIQIKDVPMENNHQINKSSNQQIIFYTALYHCMIHPSIYNDVDGRYRGRDDKIHNTEGKFNYYTVFSLWDTYRALHPLLTIIDKKRTNDFINTFIKQYEQGGRLPIWELSSNETNCMIGYHVVSVIWDAYNKGIRDYDVNKAFEAMKDIATDYNDYTDSVGSSQLAVGNKNTDLQLTTYNLQLKKEARERCADADALESYNRYGYVRSDDSHESVSKTLEYAYDDWCIAQMANALGKKKDFEYYTNRSHNWMNVYDPTTGFMRARKNGTLYEPFSPYTVDNNYTEANSWQYSFYVPHDLYRFDDLTKNRVKIEELLNAKNKTEGREQADITGLIGQYAHGNEPSHHILYMLQENKNFAESNNLIQKIIDSFYLNQPDGLIGNEDCGQMSAWYILSSLGIYPYCPGKNELTYIIPQFSYTIKTIDIFIENIKPQIDTDKFHKFYVVKNNLDSLNYLKKNSYIFINKLIKKEAGCFARGSYRFIGDKPTAPYILSNKRNFADSMKIKIKNLDLKKAKKDFKYRTKNTHSKKEKDFYFKTYREHYSIFYSLNNETFKLYDYPFYIYKNSKIDFYVKDNYNLKLKSPIQTATFTKLPTDRKIILHNQYNPSYNAGGAEGLIDGIHGKLNWRAGDWQGYQGQDVEVIMALDKPTAIKKIAANFLEDQNSWIFYPKAVSFYVSNDSINWTLVETIPTNKSDHNLDVSISKFQATDFANNTDKNTKLSALVPSFGGQGGFKFIKMVAKSFGKMPEWHEGRGFDTFVFIDEFVVE